MRRCIETVLCGATNTVQERRGESRYLADPPLKRMPGGDYRVAPWPRIKMSNRRPAISRSQRLPAALHWDATPHPGCAALGIA